MTQNTDAAEGQCTYTYREHVHIVIVLPHTHPVLVMVVVLLVVLVWKRSYQTATKQNTLCFSGRLQGDAEGHSQQAAGRAGDDR